MYMYIYICIYMYIYIYIIYRMTHSDSMITIPWALLTKELENIPIEIKLHLTSVINVLRTSDKQL